MITVAENRKIIIARAELALTQKDLANAVGVSRQTIVSIEKGSYNPSLNLCKAICKKLNKTLDELFGEEY
mgnify:CR=1 FL=1